MGKQWWFVGFLCAAILAGVPSLALAQAPAPPPAAATKAEAMEDIQQTRVAIQVGRQAIVSQAMDLTPEEMQVFWPVYRDYRVEAVKIGDRIVALLQRYAATYDDMTEQAADKLVADFVKIEQARANVKAKFLPKFKKVLPAKKVARFYQVENKLDVMILHEMAESIPLLR
ncbi:MAG: hypothetical protein EHM71_09610 [Zetaproteobacteria bacterium]|nr:MAG: hypothetical protein EHM71_09610 [Zetaproteobacteria bacterium]